MSLKSTPFHDRHLSQGAKMGPFAGWDMPIQYPQGILAEHRQCRESAALFDTSHMGEFVFRGDIRASGLEQAVTFPVHQLEIGRCKYGLMLNSTGGIIDDLIIYRKAQDELFIVVNAGTIDKDFSNLKSHINHQGTLENISDSTAKLDLQGPMSRDILTGLVGESISGLKYFRHQTIQWQGQPLLISRTGYTGELGFELYGSHALLQDLADRILSDSRVSWAGLGARDVLRLEVGYSLYGSDMDDTTNPLECGLESFVDMTHSFTGKSALEKSLADGLKTTRVAFRTTSRRAPRSHFSIEAEGQTIGTVTSGSFSPMTGTGIGIGIVDKKWNKPGDSIKISDGKSSMDAVLCSLPFYGEGSVRK